MRRGAGRGKQPDEGAAVYDLKYPIRSVASVRGDPEHHKFLVGTNSLRDDNEIHLLLFRDDRNDVSCERIFPHPNEIWHLACSPEREDTFFSVYNQVGRYHGALWQARGLEEELATSLTLPLTLLCELPEPEGPIRSIHWEGTGRAYSADTRSICMWDIDAAGASLKEAARVTPDAIKSITNVAVDPVRPQQVAAVIDSDVQLYDFRTGKLSQTIAGAHDMGARDVQFNPGQLNHMVTGGDDCLVKFWDRRKLGSAPAQPVRVFPGHTHWVWCVRYNPSHDQFVLSAGSDTAVKLWHALSVSSAATGDEHSSDRSDGLIRSVDQHEESVYTVTWTACANDPYLFMAASYDGRVSLNHVPSSEKMKVWA